MSTFLPVGEQRQQEIEAIRTQLSANEPMTWPTIENEPLNEYQVSHLATMAFPTLFPDGKGDPTNQALLRDVPLQERRGLIANGCIILLTTPDFHTGLLIWFTESAFYSKVEYSSNKIQVKLISLLMSCIKWLQVKTWLYSCPNCQGMLAILLVQMLTGIKWEKN